MSSRFSRALRDLAAALDEVEAAAKEREPSCSAALGVGPSSSAGSGAAGLPAGASSTGPVARAQATRTVEAVRPKAEPTASSVAYRQDIRCYIIVSNPRNPSFVGFYEGKGASAWRAIESRLEGGRLSGSLARLRRVANRAEAIRIWSEARPSEPMPDLQI